jgi:hypothetical protein
VIAELCHFKTVICLFTDVLQHRYYASVYRYKHPVYNPTVEIASTQYTDSSRLSITNRRPRSLSSRSHPSSPPPTRSTVSQIAVPCPFIRAARVPALPIVGPPAIRCRTRVQPGLATNTCSFLVSGGHCHTTDAL